MSGPIVEVKQGQLQGKVLTTQGGKEYYSFSGIPYAEPPVGNLRFKEPVPIGPWNGIKDATKEENPCTQFQVIHRALIGSEDCLYLNVYTPIINSLILLPVILFIHGGGFAEGSGTARDFGPEYLIEQDIVMININFRLGVFGFLCTDSVNATGDMGLKDQNLVLKWVKENVKSFGGDPDNITLFGFSAGSASVEYHILSPKSKNLFNKAILESGSVLNPWARLRGGVQYAERFAKSLGYKNDQGLFEFINSFDSETLVQNAFKELKEEDYKKGYCFSFIPVINELEGYDGFLNEEPIEILRKGTFNKVPVISGLCDKEGFFFKWFLKDVNTEQFFSSGNFLEYTPEYLKENYKDLDSKFRELYFNNAEDKTVDFLSDLNFNGGVLYSLYQRLKHNPHEDYFYNFVYDGGLNLFKRILNLNDPGAGHGDDGFYIGSNAYVDLNALSAKDIIVKDRMIKMWTDFVKTGNPTPQTSDLIDVKWESTKEDNFKYLIIGENMNMQDGIYTPERSQLWMDIYSKVK